MNNMKVRLHQWLRRNSLLPIQGDLYLDVIFVIVMVILIIMLGGELN